MPAGTRGRAALDITWDDGPNASYGSAEYREQLLASVRAPGTTHRNLGDVDAAFSSASKTVEAEYLVPHLAHMPMEPLVAVARFRNGRAEIWAPTQNPQANRTDVAKLLGSRIFSKASPTLRLLLQTCAPRHARRRCIRGWAGTARSTTSFTRSRLAPSSMRSHMREAPTRETPGWM
jgi:hypothetical protein